MSVKTDMVDGADRLASKSEQEGKICQRPVAVNQGTLKDHRTAIIRLFKELYLTLFTLGFRFRAPKSLGGGWGPWMDAGKGVMIVSMIQILTLQGITWYCEIQIGKRFSFDCTPWTVIFGLSVYSVNYYILLTRGHGTRFERDFRHLKMARKTLLITICVVLSLAGLTFSLYWREPAFALYKANGTL